MGQFGDEKPQTAEKRGLRTMSSIDRVAVEAARKTSKKIPSREGWREATAVAKRRGGSSVGDNPPQGLLALSPPNRGFSCNFIPYITPRQAMWVLLSKRLKL